MFLRSNPTREISAGKNSSPPPNVNVAVAHIRVGSYYEIDHSILPQRSPEQLKSIRVVMVSKITARDVSLRYPSMYSLRSHFEVSRAKPEKKNGGPLPVLDESHVMASELAGDLLYRRIAPHEISVNRKSWSFWVSAASRRNSSSRRETISQPEGKCWSELKSGGMIKWGRRLRVQYQSRDIDYKKNKEGEENCRMTEKKEEEQVSKEEWEEDGNETEGTKQDADETNDGARKRKLVESRTERLALRAKVYEENKEKKIVVYKRKSDKKFIDRWAIERYKLAEKNMLKVMKEKNAVFGNSILRSELRSEARKLIGDTGLLDHLLKHMAGKVAPGGQDRFRRKHNADGAMEYWLESSDLVHIRKEAGVEDPYWTPPPGWKLGDSPTQDPVCAGQIREMREGLASLKREMEKLASKKDEEELVIVTTPNSCVTSQNDNLMTPAKEIYADLLRKKYKIEDQLAIIAENMRKMEEDMGWLKKTVEEKNGRKREIPLLLEDSPVEGQVKGMQEPLPLDVKTGFRICRPVGSFSWPNLAVSDTEFASLSSHRPTYSSPSPSCPVKPLPAKRPLLLPFTFAATPPQAPTNLFNL